ncbi:putative transferase, protein kinase RLK-Pelle-RLCK-VIIa-2 family [Helianthus debilis subsp. tardiflorus]
MMQIGMIVKPRVHAGCNLVLFILTLLQAAVSCLGLIDHPNLVKLIGYCTDDDHKLLVYEYMERGSLENYLSRRRFYTGPLAWNLRIKIALGAAKGLAYFHKPESTVMCHDFNSTSILIDSNDNARISNFGMVKDGPVDSSGQVIYTKGYADPEYIKTGHFTKSSNIYSFGVVLLELLTGQRCIDKNGPEGERILVEFAKPFLTKDLKEIENIIDPHRDEHYSSGAAHGAALIAKRCLYEDPKCRPTAHEIVEELERLQLPPTNFSNA